MAKEQPFLDLVDMMDATLQGRRKLGRREGIDPDIDLRTARAREQLREDGVLGSGEGFVSVQPRELRDNSQKSLARKPERNRRR